MFLRTKWFLEWIEFSLQILTCVAMCYYPNKFFVTCVISSDFLGPLDNLVHNNFTIEWRLMLIKYKIWHQIFLLKHLNMGCCKKLFINFALSTPNYSHETMLTKAMVNIVEYVFHFYRCKDLNISSTCCQDNIYM